jgi:hypothetical protein
MNPNQGQSTPIQGGGGGNGTYSNNKKNNQGINYDPAKRGGAAFGNEDYEHLKSKGHSDKQINKYISGLDNSQVSNKYKPQGGHERTEQQQQNFDNANNNTFTTAAGYTMEKGAYNSGAQDIYNQYDQDSNGKGGGVGSQHIGNFDKDGYLTHDSTKYQVQNNTALKEAGYKVGDMLFKPGSKDNLNGRELTGRVARITASGNYIPEYVNDAINSSHKSTGNAGYGGEVGLGADQAAYNRQYEQDHDVEYGQTNQQLEANGVSDQGIDEYWERTDSQRQAIADMRGGNSAQSSHSYGGEQYESDYANFGSDQGNPGFQAPTPRGNDQHSVQQSNGPQYQDWQSQIASTQFGGGYSGKPGKTKASNMNFNFNPYKFTQGQ